MGGSDTRKGGPARRSARSVRNLSSGGSDRVELRFPTLEVFSAISGDALSGPSRMLTKRERDLAVPIFGASINLDDVRIVRSPVASAPTTLGNSIRVTAKYWPTGLPDSTLIHELTHVWQFQTRGTSYISNSLCHQVAAMIQTGDRGNAYILTGDLIEKAGSIDRLPAEKQAVFVEAWFMDYKAIFPSSGSGIVRLRDNATSQSMMAQVRRARPLPSTQIIDEAAFGPGRGHRANLRQLRDGADATGIPLLRLEF